MNNKAATSGKFNRKLLGSYFSKLWLLFFVGFGFWGLSLLPAAAQDGLQWTQPQAVSSELEHASYPALAVDTSGTIHLFWFAKRIDREFEVEAILYARYQDGNWTQPVDIILSPGGQSANFPRAIVDNVGRIHLVWSGPGSTGPFGPLYHSWAPVNEAGIPQSWQSPIQIADGTYQSDIAMDPQGRIHIVYASVADNRGICHVVSEDNGDNWGQETCIPHLNPLRDLEAEVRPRLAIDSHGYLHVVWVLDDYSSKSQLRYSGRAVYYARSTDSGATWSDLAVIDEVDGRGKYSEDKDGLQPEWSTIAVDTKDRVHILWVGNPNMFRYHQWSNDGGETWSQRQVAVPIGGYNWWMGATADGDGNLHFISPSLNGLAYNKWTKETGWGNPMVIKQAGWAPHAADAVVALGNELHAVWQSGAGASASEDQRIMHAMLYTGSQRETPHPVPTLPAVESQASPIPSAQLATTPTPTPRVLPSFSSDTPPSGSVSTNPAMPLLIGALSTVIFIGIVWVLGNKR